MLESFGIRDQGHLCFIKGNTSNAKIWKVEATSFLANLVWLQDIGQQTAGTPAASAPCRDLAKIQIKEKRQPAAFYNMRGEESLLRQMGLNCQTSPERPVNLHISLFLPYHSASSRRAVDTADFGSETDSLIQTQVPNTRNVAELR